MVKITDGSMAHRRMSCGARNQTNVIKPAILHDNEWKCTMHSPPVLTLATQPKSKGRGDCSFASALVLGRIIKI